MSEYCKQPNGRRKLLETIKSRVDNLDSFPELLYCATSFHREIATIPHLDTIITTNWDDYFERFCGATPIVTDQDFAFWDMPGRKVFKIHGSISNYGSIVATAEDYDACYQRLREQLVGANLKMVLATATVVFAGYSLRDDDFIRVYDLLKRTMGELLPHAFVLTLDSSSIGRFLDLGMTPIVTDATYFIEVLKGHLIQEGRMIDDERFEGVNLEAAVMTQIHHNLPSKIDLHKYPAVVMCMSYQDGVLHALERIVSRAKTGEYSCPDRIAQLVRSYESIYREKRAAGRYEDAAYARGYQNGLMFLALGDDGRRCLPRYFGFGGPEVIRSLAHFRRVFCGRRPLHQRAHRRARHLAGHMGEGMVFHHRPLLL
jgi:hypothetical protein